MMTEQLIFEFKTDISSVKKPTFLNNPFGTNVPEIVKIAAREFQEFIDLDWKNWDYDFSVRPGKMFGVLVVQKENNTLGYLGTVSGQLSRNVEFKKFVPSVFDESTDDYFINRGMTELSAIINKMKASTITSEKNSLKAQSRQKSIGLQQRLFENYNFLNLSGHEKNLLHIFKDASEGKPPVAAGECSAPKLIQYAIKHQLKPIAIAEFWWGNGMKNEDKKHKYFYPACKNRCRPILEYMLEDQTLYVNRK